MIGGFQVDAFQTAFQQGTAAPSVDGWKPRRRTVVDEIPQDDEEVMRMFADALNRYIKNRMEH